MRMKYNSMTPTTIASLYTNTSSTIPTAIGYNYSNNYCCVYSTSRTTSRAPGYMAHPRLVDGSNPIVLHPATLGLAFQTVMGAYSSPGDKRLRSLYVPTRVGRIVLVTDVCASTLEGVQYNADNNYDGGDYLSGDIEVFDKETNAATEQDKEVIPIVERAVYYFIRKFLAELAEEDGKNASVGNQRYIYWHEHVLKLAREGKHLFYNHDEHGQHLVGQIAHRFQNIDIREIGGGTGSAAASILAIPELGLSSYFFTDISAAFFEKSKEKFSPFLKCMDFRKLDITEPPVEQGFKTHAYSAHDSPV
ncbi:hypothetical protein EsH8_XIII_000024 [Colletotrichum jinshuiense]